MRPNELGGQTLENIYETDAMAVALTVNGHAELALHLAAHGDWRSEGGNIHPSILGDKPESVLVLGPDDSKVVINSLRKVATGKVLVDRRIDEAIAQSMIARLSGEDYVPKANRIAKTLARLKRL